MRPDDLARFVRVHPRLRAALEAGRPVVAVETAVFTHGLPPPLGLPIAAEMSDRVRRLGAEAGELAVVGGEVRFGLAPEELAALAEGPDVAKCALRDLPVLLGTGGSGGTTVSATVWLAARLGVRVVATGGIGGVHPGGHDVSADLGVLARTPVVLVCAGPKSLLDVAATAEALDSHSVPVLGYRTWRLPAFYVRASGVPVQSRVAGVTEVARIVAARDSLALQAAVVLAVPPPRGTSLSAGAVAAIAARADAEAKEAGARGPARTPFVLAHMAAATGGATLRANRALLLRNATVAAGVALAIAAGQAAP